MITGKKIIGLLLFVVVLGSCKKDKDVISSQSIHGQIYNLCNDSGLVNVSVFLQENSKTIMQTVSGSNGNFSFTNAQIHSSNDYTYNIVVQSVDYIGGGVQPAIDGDDVEINKSNLSQTFILNVVPHAKIWGLYFPSSISSSIYNDTFTLVLQQKTYLKNAPSAVNTLTMCNCPCPQPSPPKNLIDNLHYYTMGWWYSTLNKTMNGVHTVQQDSFYVGWWTNVTDTIPW